jgi:hypothetical protein
VKSSHCQHSDDLAERSGGAGDYEHPIKQHKRVSRNHQLAKSICTLELERLGSYENSAILSNHLTKVTK